MSHACVLVAVDVADPSNPEEVNAAVSFQMDPYDESGEWFRDGSRWDWWTIGGRYAGMLDKSYDPDKDDRNFEVCRWCAGTGTRTDMVVHNGCNGCGGTGIARKFSNAPFAGDVTQKGKWNPESLRNAPYAFLRERHWHEGSRLGWFGCETTTECERKSDDPDVLVRRCMTIGDENARICTWNEPYDFWKEQFVTRFIEPLPSETVLVVVDYHV